MGRVMNTAIDFFAGSGLVSIGLGSNFKTIWANDIDEDKKEIFDRNVPSVAMLKKDINQIQSNEVPFADLYWASFPCQDLSLAGQHKGLEGERSSLVNEFLRILQGQDPDGRPPVIALENVYGLVTSNDGNDYCHIHNALEALGYNVGCIVLDASYWVPQSRVRVFVVGAKNTLDIRGMTSDQPTWCHPSAVVKLSRRLPNFRFWKLGEPKTSIKRLKDIVIRDAEFDEFKSAHLMRLIPAQHIVKIHQNFAEDPGRVFSGYKRTRNGAQTLEIRFDEIGGCLRTASGGSSKQLLVYVKDGNIVIRYMIPREAARLMGAPEGFWLPQNKISAYTAMGDAVAVPVTAYISEMLLSPLVEISGKELKIAI